ncbi:adhesion G-protein coupled receptor G6 [Elysia marginata]|uniref:Adhesion G-protein coupled receptor G6 n=1 Tax=Elysia marginata TaxID=1093978 RepID=A0AAV4GFJ2_9GAST|nr:adhesion G-protein coupled receptor G6 [Elysia marginata]
MLRKEASSASPFGSYDHNYSFPCNREWAERNLPNFDIAIELPEALVRNTIRYSDSALRLSMFIYRKSSLFVASGRSSGAGRGDAVVDHLSPPGEINSAIISASLGGRPVQGLQDKIRLVFKPLKIPEEEDGWDTHCVFWDDVNSHDTDVNRRARWSSRGCVYNGTLNGRHVCLCDHLTNFAVLLDFYGERRSIATAHETSLSVITLGRAQQTLLNMAIALLCFQTVFLFGVKQTAVWPVCMLVALLLHYFILVSFVWMLIEAVLQYLTFVKVLGTYISRYTLKTVLPAWGFPVLPVAAVLATDYNLYLGRTD